MSNSTDSLVCRFITKPMLERKMLTGTENQRNVRTYSMISKIEVELHQKNVDKTVPILIL
jgi:hypothetical protein